MSTPDNVHKAGTHNSKYKFKIPYDISDPGLKTESQRYMASLDAEDCLLGYGMIKLGVRGEEDHLEFRLHDFELPLLRTQSWFKKTYSQQKVTSFWAGILKEGREIDAHCLDFAVTIITDPRSINLQSLEMNPTDSRVQEVSYRKKKGITMILCDGHSRLYSAQRIANDLQHLTNDENRGHITWIAKFYDKDKIHRHPREYEIKYYLCHGDD